VAPAPQKLPYGCLRSGGSFFARAAFPRVQFKWIRFRAQRALAGAKPGALE